MSEVVTNTRDDYAAAFDAVEEPAAPATPSVDVPATPDAAAPPVETAEQKAGRTAGRLRDEQGRLLPGKPVREATAPIAAAPAAATASSTAAPAAVATRPAVPGSWKKELAQHWDKIDPAVAQYIHEREGQYIQGVSTYKSEADKAKAVWDTIAPYQPLLQQHGIDPIKHIGVMFNAHQRLATADPQSRLQMFAELARQYQVPLNLLVPQQDGTVQQPQQDPQVQWLAQQYQTLAGQLQNYQTQHEQQSQQEINATLDNFKAAHEHYETVRSTMAGLLQSGLATDLEGAYAAAIRMPQHSEIFDAIQQQKSAAADAEKKRLAGEAVARARSNAVSIPSNSPTGTMTQGRGDQGIREHYAAIVESATGRV